MICSWLCRVSFTAVLHPGVRETPILGGPAFGAMSAQDGIAYADALAADGILLHYGQKKVSAN
jgi:hypothetical protein